MSKKAHEIELRFLDHVAIRVVDMEVSIKWYQQVLGLKKYQLPEWGDAPIFLLSGKSGIALFPGNANDPKVDLKSKNVTIDHFAFNVTRENFEKAMARYKELNLAYSIQDHIYFDSIYTHDPDGHKVELTTIKVNEDDFYTLN